MKTPYRYRWDGASYGAEKRFARIVARLGCIKYIRGYRYHGRYNTSHEAVLVVGEHGSARFHGVCWGYSGQGPRTLAKLLELCGMSQRHAAMVANSPRREHRDLGDDWRLTHEAKYGNWQFVRTGKAGTYVFPVTTWLAAL